MNDKEAMVFIEDTLCKGFVLSLGTRLPKKNAMDNMMSWINIQRKKEDVPLTEQYVYDAVPMYISFLFDKS